ncbi:MAG: hypothetical protein HQK65_18205 [Desulfamplus sp.]|nr:hypothetical protein [Desulfamplus sp.]
MKCVEIINLRSSSAPNEQFIDELLKGINESDTSAYRTQHLVEIKIYHHSVVETDLSIHIYWKSEQEIKRKSPLGLRFYSALKHLGLLNHSLWVERASLKFPYGDIGSGDIPS